MWAMVHGLHIAVLWGRRYNGMVQSPYIVRERKKHHQRLPLPTTISEKLLEPFTKKLNFELCLLEKCYKNFDTLNS